MLKFSAKGIDNKAVEIDSEADGYTKGIGDGRIFFYNGKKNCSQLAEDGKRFKIIKEESFSVDVPKT